MIYVDPSAGSIILQVAFAAVIGGALVAKRWWGALVGALRGVLRRIRSH